MGTARAIGTNFSMRWITTSRKTMEKADEGQRITHGVTLPVILTVAMHQ